MFILLFRRWWEYQKKGVFAAGIALDILFISQIVINMLINIIKISYFPWKLSRICDMMDHSHLIQMLYYLMSMVLLNTKSYIIFSAMMKLHLLLQLPDLHNLFQEQAKHIQLSPIAFYLVAIVHGNHGTHFRTPKNLILLNCYKHLRIPSFPNLY